ncbi:hypothetical protein N9A67_06925 [Rhodobacteraceae bacterium]|nr:hypothetical protein [Paracoccaceae bacterium]
MSRGIISKVIDEIGEKQAEIRSEEYAMINVRPGEKVASMLDLIVSLSGKSASALISDEISSRLAEYATSSYDHIEPILDATQKVIEQDSWFQNGCALEILEKKGVLKTEDHSMPKLF